MKHSIVPLFLTGMVLLLVVAVPVSRKSATVTGTSVRPLAIRVKLLPSPLPQANFTTTDGDVTLDMSGEDENRCIADLLLVRHQDRMQFKMPSTQDGRLDAHCNQA